MALLGRLADLVESVTADFEGYDYARALQATEEFFWQFCDDYLELVKDRAYGSGVSSSSAQTALRAAVSTLLRLFAPFLPYVTEEVWSWNQTSSVHRSSWPTAGELRSLTSASAELKEPVLTIAADVLRQIRKAKSDAKKSVRAEVRAVTGSDTAHRLEAVRAVLADLRNAGNVVGELTTLEVSADEPASVAVQLAEGEPVA